MRKIQFGNTGMKVSNLCLGTMTFGTSWEIGSDKLASEKILNAYLDAGGNFLDTANLYTKGESESMLGEILGANRKKVVISTKYSLLTDSTDVNSFGNHRRNMMLSVEDSLRRLKTDFIDVFWVHAWYSENRVGDIVRAMDDLVSSGKVLYWGFSDTPAWVCSEANAIAEVRGWIPPSALQLQYSLVERTSERELLPFAAHHDLAVTYWSPLAGGFLSGKHLNTTEEVDSKRSNRMPALNTEKNMKILHQLCQFAKELDVSPAQLALAWLLDRQPTHIPIIGARTLDQLHDNMQATELVLPPNMVQELSDLSEIDLGFPYGLLKAEKLKEVMYGPFKDM